jgi:NADPH-dependent 2,4-dienoyl-CoA reductase/sulfur reductase-like enzyme
MKNYDLVIIGGGPAGLAAAVKAYDLGMRNILLAERDDCLGGILNQCIHNGFGLHRFKTELTGPEYAGRYIKMLEERGIDYMLKTMVMDLAPDKTLTLMNSEYGLFSLKPKAVILAMGCRERPRGALNMPGDRPSGIFTAGTAQRLLNIDGFMPGREVVILGSGDIGLIMARRMTLEGAKVKLVAEINSFSAGLKRNIVQCLDDFDIPLYFNTTISRVVGKNRVEGVYLSKADEYFRVIPDTEEFVSCDTVLLSVGLIPENELSRKAHVKMAHQTRGPIVDNTYMTGVPGIFACGNVLHVHDLVDNVSEEAEEAAKNAVAFIENGTWKADLKIRQDADCKVLEGAGVSYTLPQVLNFNSLEKLTRINFRVKKLYEGASIKVNFDGQEMSSRKMRVMAPGAMQAVYLKKEDLEKHLPQTVTVSIEEEG